MSETRNVESAWRKVLAVIGIVLLISLMGVMAVGATSSPTVEILPDAILKKGETVTVKGHDFPINTTARIDLLLPDASTVEGITSGAVDVNGSFTLTFIAPDKNGDGYVKVVDGTIVVSTLVTFEGTVAPNQQLQVSLNPNLLLEGQTSHITVLASFLEDSNYVLDFLAVNPFGQDTTSYYVLHKGKLEFDFKFDYEGYYWLNISVENTPYFYTQYLEIKDNPNGGGGGGGGDDTNYTINWEISDTGNVYDIMLWKEGYGYITTGNITVRSPDGKTTSVKIQNSVATYTATSMGTYTLKYIASGKQYASSFEYRVTISFTSSQFDDNGISRLALLVDGVAPEGTVEVNVTGAVDDVTTIEDGVGEYQATVVGDYSFQINYMGISKTSKEVYEDIYEISTLYAIVDGDTIIVTGSVVGQKTGTAGSGIQVQVTVQSQDNYKQTVTTGNDGTFEVYVGVVNKGGVPNGVDAQIRANIMETGSTSYKTATVHLSHDIWAEYGMWIILAVIGIVLLLWWKGFFYKWSKGKFAHPPKASKSSGSKAREDTEMGW